MQYNCNWMGHGSQRMADGAAENSERQQGHAYHGGAGRVPLLGRKQAVGVSSSAGVILNAVETRLVLRNAVKLQVHRRRGQPPRTGGHLRHRHDAAHGVEGAEPPRTEGAEPPQGGWSAAPGPRCAADGQ